MPHKISSSSSKCPLGAVGTGGVRASLSPLLAVPKPMRGHAAGVDALRGANATCMRAPRPGGNVQS